MARTTLIAAIGLVALASPALAEGPALWRDIDAGDTIEQVAIKLSAVPGVKSAKAKRDKVDINYESPGGIVIFDSLFFIVPQFVDGRVTRVGLVRQPECVGDEVALYDQIMGVLREKYPGSPFPDYDITPARFSDALRRATPDAPATLGVVQYNDTTAVMLSQTLSMLREPPSPPYGATRSMRAVGDYLWSEYQRQLEQCTRLRPYRVSYTLVYLPRTEFESISQDVVDDASSASEQSREKL